MARNAWWLASVGVVICAVGVALVWIRRDFVDRVSAMQGEIEALRVHQAGIKEGLAEWRARVERSGLLPPGELEEMREEVRRFGMGMSLLEEYSTRLGVALEILDQLVRQRGSGASGADAGVEAEVARLLNEEKRRREDEFVRDLRSWNRGLREQWIREVGVRLGLSDVQTAEVIDLYARQSDEWAELYYRVQSSGLAPGVVLEEMNRIQSDTETALTNILGPDLRDEFRRSSRALFPESPDATKGLPWEPAPEKLK